MIVTEKKFHNNKEVTKLGGTIYDKSGYRMDVNIWFRHKNEALFYIDSIGKVHGPMDQTHSTKLDSVQKSENEISYRKEFSEQIEKDQWIKSLNYQKAQPTEVRSETKHIETLLRDVSTNNINNHKRSHLTLANHFIPSYKNIETNSYSTTITKNKKPDQGVTVNIVAPVEKTFVKDHSITRERRLIDELLEAREELNTLRRARSVVDNSQIENDIRNHNEPHVSKLVTDVYPSTNATDSTRRRHYSSTQENLKNPDWDYMDGSINRGQNPQVNRSNHFESTKYSTISKEKDIGSTSCRGQTPQLQRNNYFDTTTYSTVTRENDSGPVSNYSARKENLKTQQMMGERAGSMRTLPLERRVAEMTEDIETITLQPIGKGIQDLASGHTTISRPGSRAATPRAFDTSTGANKTSFFREEQKQTGIYNTMPTHPKFNKYNSARNINQMSSYDMQDSNRRGLSTGRTSREHSWQTKTESYTLGNKNLHTALTPMSNNESFVNTHYVSSGYDDSRYPLQLILGSEEIWYQPNLSREEVINLLREKETGSFIIRNSSTFVGAYGLALKVAFLPENAVRTNDTQSDLIRHFLIETVEDGSGTGVRLKGFANESIYPSLAHLVQDHCLHPGALPTRLVISTFSASRMDHEDSGMAHSQYQYESQQRHQTQSSRAQLLSNAQRSMSSPGVNFTDINHPNPLHRHLVKTALYLGKVDVDRLIGKAAVELAVTKVMSKKTAKTTNVEIRLDSTNGITLTDKLQTLFYTRQFPAQHVLSAQFDPQLREFNTPILQNNGVHRAKIIGIVVRKQKMILRENTVHLFCEIDKSNDLNDIITFINENYLRKA